MSSTDRAPIVGDCTNLGACGIAQAGKAIEWYRGPGEYCPECGEALTPRQAAHPNTNGATGKSAAETVATAGASPPPSKRSTLKPPPVKPPPSPERAMTPAANGARPDVPLAPIVPTAAPTTAEVGDPRLPLPRKSGFPSVQGWLWVIVMLFVVSGALGYLVYHRNAGYLGGEVVTICPAGTAAPLATDLVRAYALKSGTPEDRFAFVDHGACDVRFGITPDTPDGAIATDGIVAIVNPLNPIAQISELQLREIFGGSIHDWSQLGQASGPIVPILTSAASDESKALAASLFAGIPIDRSVRRGGSSAEVTHLVTGADGDARRAIALVTFSQALAAKVVPLAYLPAPSLLTIGSHRYPYTLSFTIESATGHPTSAATGFIDYARSNFGAAIVQANGLVPHEGS